MKKRIHFEEFLAEVLLKFKEINAETVNLLLDILDDPASPFEIIFHPLVGDIIYNFSLQLDDNNAFRLADSFALSSKNISKIESQLSANRALSLSEKNEVSSWLYRLDMKEFVLRKMAKYGEIEKRKGHPVDLWCLDTSFISMMEQSTLASLVESGDIFGCWSSNGIAYEDSKIFSFTKQGKVLCYMLNHKEEVHHFQSILEQIGYNSKLLPLFLKEQVSKNQVAFQNPFAPLETKNGQPVLNLVDFGIFHLNHDIRWDDRQPLVLVHKK